MKKNNSAENYLEKIPARNGDIGWKADDSGIVTLEMENRGIFNRIAQKLFKKPKVSYIHLDENGSFIWQQIDGETNIIKIGEAVHDRFSEKAEPLYPRLAKFIRILESYGFIVLK